MASPPPTLLWGAGFGTQQLQEEQTPTHTNLGVSATSPARLSLAPETQAAYLRTWGTPNSPQTITHVMANTTPTLPMGHRDTNLLSQPKGHQPSLLLQPGSRANPEPPTHSSTAQIPSNSPL